MCYKTQVLLVASDSKMSLPNVLGLQYHVKQFLAGEGAALGEAVYTGLGFLSGILVVPALRLWPQGAAEQYNAFTV